MRTIEISLSKTSIQKAINELERTKKRLMKKLKIVAERLAQEGARAAEAAYGSPVAVSVEEIEDGYAILASGDAVVFLEFGAGDATDSGHPYAKALAPEGVAVVRGSWSREHANQYATQGWWLFGGIRMTEVIPRRGLLMASQEMSQVADRICREVFEK